MIAALIALLMADPAAANTAAAEPEIVVIAQKLKNWRGEWRQRKGVFECSTIKSTGDNEIDAIGCQAITSCVKPVVPQFQEITDAKQSKAIRNQRLTALSKSLLPCIEDHHRTGIAALADRRAGV